MKIVDLTVLHYAIDRSAKHHRKARSCWEAALRSNEPVGSAWNVILGFLRLTTLTSDAHPAALVLSHGVTLVSFDNDFARSPRLQWINPLTDKELSQDP